MRKVLVLLLSSIDNDSRVLKEIHTYCKYNIVPTTITVNTKKTVFEIF